MNCDPCNCPLKIGESTGIPTPKVRVHLGVWGFIPSYFPTFLGAWNVTLGLHSSPAPLQAFALVASPRLRLWQCMFFKFWIYAICVVSSHWTYASVSSSMASWANDMIISITSYNVDNISFFALGGDTRSTCCEASLSHPLCKGGFIALLALPLVLGVGCPICCNNSILWGLIACPWILISSPWTLISIPWCSRGRPCGICFTLGKLSTTLVFGIVVQSTSPWKMTSTYTIWHNHKWASLFGKSVG